MPELMTKHPDVTLRVLESQGAECGAGQTARILTECPPEQFCRLEGGELCVYGVEQVGQMTQVSREELAAQVCPNQSATTSLGGSAAVVNGAHAVLFWLVLFAAAVMVLLWRAYDRRAGAKR